MSSFIGIDLGTSTIKCVVLKKRDSKNAELVFSAKFSRNKESLLSDKEAMTFLFDHLTQNNMFKGDIGLVIPQYLSTIQVSDFPVGQEKNLKELVHYETMHLSGLSDESFVYSFCKLPPGNGRDNPVLMGLARSAVIESFLELVDENTVNLSNFSPSMIACINGLFYKYPEIHNESGPNLILDIGHEHTSAALVSNGQVLYSNNFFFGGGQFSSISAMEEDEELFLDSQSPASLISIEFETEYNHFIGHWRSSALKENANKLIKNVYICGSGAKYPGWLVHLKKKLGLNIICLDHQFDEFDHDFLPAYGMALQGLNIGSCQIPVIPEFIQLQNHRRQRLPIAWVAVAFMVFTMILLTIFTYRNELKRENILEYEQKNLMVAEKLIPQVMKINDQVRHNELVMYPFVERGNRTRTFLKSIDWLGKIRDDKSWFFYLADAATYYNKPDINKKKQREKSKSLKSKLLENNKVKINNKIHTILVSEIMPLKYLIAETMVPRSASFNKIKKLIEKFNDQNTPFKKVDILEDDQTMEHDDSIRFWRRFYYREMHYNLLLPLKNTVEYPAEEEPNAQVK